MNRSRRARAISVSSAVVMMTGAGALAGCASEAGGAEGEQELTVLFNQSNEAGSEWLAKEYEERTGVKINPVLSPYDEIASNLALDQQSGANTIDVATPWYVSLGDLAADGVIQDLTDWVEDTPSLDVDDFIPAIWEPYSTLDDKIYGLPFDGDTHVLFYNKEILARNGIDEPPATWDEYLEQATIVTENEGDDGVYGASVFGQQSPLILGASFANRLAGFGGSFLDEAGEPTIETPEAIAAAQALVDIDGVALPTPAETDFGAGNSAWFAGKVAFIENWTDLGIKSEDPTTGSEVSGKWGVTLLPVGQEGQQPRASLVSGFSWVITGNTDKRDLAEDFVEFAASSEVNAALLTESPPTGVDPSRLSSLEDETYGEKFPEIQEVNRATLSDALAWPTGKNSTQAAQVLTDELASLIAGTGGTAGETMQRVQEQWETLLADD